MVIKNNMEILNNSYLKFIELKNISNCWDVKRLSFNIDFSGSFQMSRLWEIIKPISNKIKKVDYDWNRRIVSKITFNDGRLYLREDNKTWMDVYIVYPKNLLVSNINFHQGAVAINNFWEELVCSTHYQPYEINRELINDDYLILVLRSEEFKNYVINQKSNWIKTESKFSFIKNLEIPIPELEEQNEIVKKYHAKLKDSINAEVKSQELAKEIDNCLIEELAIDVKEQEIWKKWLNLIDFSGIKERWVDKINVFNLFTSNKYKIVSLADNSDYYVDIKRWKSPKYSEKWNKIILNQKCNRWNKIDLQFSKVVDEDWLNWIDNNLLTQTWDILINSTWEGTIWRASLIKEEFEWLLYDSHLLLLRLNQKMINPEFFVYFFNNYLWQKQVNNVKSAQATKQTELWTWNLLKIFFPLPPKDIQEKIVKHIFKLKEEIKRLKKLSEGLKESAKFEVEKEIFN